MALLLTVAFFMPAIIAIARGDRLRWAITAMNFSVLLLEWAFLTSYYGLNLLGDDHEHIAQSADALLRAGEIVHGAGMVVLLSIHRLFDVIWGAPGAASVVVWTFLTLWAAFDQTRDQEEIP